MPETSFNPAVNPVVESDFSSNSSGRRYNSTTDDLLDRIREGIDALTGGGGGGGSSSLKDSIFWGWVYYKKNDITFSIRGYVKINDDTSVTPYLLVHDIFVPLSNLGDTILFISNDPIKTTHIGRVDGNLTDEWTFLHHQNPYLPTTGKAIIKIEDVILLYNIENVIFSLEVVVLPQSLLNEDEAENYFNISINGTANTYALDSYNGIPIINRITITDFANIGEIEITAGTGIIVEYKIISSYPTLIED